MNQPQAQNASDAHCFVTELVTSNSSCNASEVFHTMVYFQSFLSHWAWKETLPSTLSPWKNVTLNSIYHYKVHASQWNPNTASEGEAKRKWGKKVPQTQQILNMTAQIFLLVFWIQFNACLCSIFSANPRSTNQAFSFLLLFSWYKLEAGVWARLYHLWPR